ncbi:MAG: DUF3106 domain-containing protein [Alphaproteobacteria bacterium]|nr:DUF3106 domain-containing protein [Alphaproteobacteria bacterium]
MCAQKQIYNILLATQLILSSLFMCTIGHAQTPSSTNDIPQYQEKLQRWNNLSEEQRQTIREKSKQITPEKLKALKTNYKQFKQMPANDQQRIKDNYKSYKRLNAEGKKRIKEKHKEFKRLPLENKQGLRRKANERRKPSGVEHKVNSKRSRPSVSDKNRGNKRELRGNLRGSKRQQSHNNLNNPRRENAQDQRFENLKTRAPKTMHDSNRDRYGDRRNMPDYSYRRGDRRINQRNNGRGSSQLRPRKKTKKIRANGRKRRSKKDN